MRRKVGHQNLILLFSISSGADSLFVGWNSTRVTKSKSKKNVVHSLLLISRRVGKWRQRYSGDEFQEKKFFFCNRRAPSPTSRRFSSPNCTRRFSRRRRRCVIPPAERSLPRCTPAYKSKFSFSFGSLVLVIFLVTQVTGLLVSYGKFFNVYL